MKIVVGLGNPGQQYQNTRHNAGFTFVDFLARHLQAPDWSYVDRFKAHATGAFYLKEKIVLIKPWTYMNLSGISVEKVVDYYKISSADLFAVYDDIDLALGSFLLRPGGGAGTHNGARSIKATLQSRGMDFRRLRLGIDRGSETDYERNLSTFVLGKMEESELKIFTRCVQTAAEALLFCWEQGMAAAMQAYNKRKS